MAKTKTQDVSEEIISEIAGDFLVVQNGEHGFIVQQCAAEQAAGVIVGAHLTHADAIAQIAALEAANG